jgi:hypothetical protein
LCPTAAPPLQVTPARRAHGLAASSKPTSPQPPPPPPAHTPTHPHPHPPRQALIWDLSSLGQQQPPAWAPGGGANGAAPFAAAGPAGGGGAAAANGGGGEASSGLDPILSYTAGSDISQLKWSVLQPDWIAINYGNTTEVLRV